MGTVTGSTREIDELARLYEYLLRQRFQAHKRIIHPGTGRCKANFQPVFTSLINQAVVRNMRPRQFLDRIVDAVADLRQVQPTFLPATRDLVRPGYVRALLGEPR